MSYDELEAQATTLKAETCNEISRVLTQKGYSGIEPCVSTDSYYSEQTIVWGNKYGNGIIVSIRGKDETHIDNVSIEDALVALHAVVKAVPIR